MISTKQLYGKKHISSLAEKKKLCIFNIIKYAFTYNNIITSSDLRPPKQHLSQALCLKPGLSSLFQFYSLANILASDEMLFSAAVQSEPVAYCFGGNFLCSVAFFLLT
jgi:hypothetical protein